MQPLSTVLTNHHTCNYGYTLHRDFVFVSGHDTGWHNLLCCTCWMNVVRAYWHMTAVHTVHSCASVAIFLDVSPVLRVVFLSAMWLIYANTMWYMWRVLTKWVICQQPWFWENRINMQQWFPTILISFLSNDNACHLYYYLVHLVAFLKTLRNISRMNFIKTEPINCTCLSHILRGFPQCMADIFGTTGKPRTFSFGFVSSKPHRRQLEPIVALLQETYL